ncbi:MAG: efflux RND transporter permease subunit [Alphaproteobacteria bacterium]|nr:efflux RND transporter permease subunit [Alphaproteobacteria bacterium]
MNFSSFFITRPRFAGVIALVMILAGIIAGFVLPISQYPDITPPQIVVSANYPGANASVLSDTVATPIENQINGVEGMLYMSSTSTDTGQYTLTITFDVGTDPDIAQVKVENRLDKAKPFLPEIVVQEGLNVIQQSANILAFIALTSPNATYSPLYLSNFAFTQIQNPFKRIAGMGDVNIYGPQHSIRIWLDVKKMNGLQLTSNQVIQAIESQNQVAGVGSLASSPAPQGTNQVLSLTTKGLLKDVEDFEQIVIRGNLNGGLIRLKDIARVELGADNYQLNASFDNQPSVVMALTQLPNSNSLQIMKDLKQQMAHLKKTFPKDMEFEIVYDSTTYVRASITAILMTLFLTFLLVMAVVYVFLQDIKATLIPMITIPVSLIATFVVIYVLGFDINILTLFAMILAIGLVVDDAIVVVERVQYLIKYDKLSALQASQQAMKDITSSVIATTLVLMAIFIPVGLMAGMTGKIYQQFAVTLSTAVFFSSVNALTLSPALCAIFLNQKEDRPFKWKLWFDKILNKGENTYVKVVAFLCYHIKTSLIITFGGIALLSWLFMRIPQEFIPQEDQGIILANIQLPSTASINQTQQLLYQMSEQSRKMSGVQSFIGISGNSMLSASGENIAMAAIVLTSWDERDKAGLSMEKILADLNQKFSSVPNAEINFFAMPSIPGVGNADGVSFQLNAINQNITPEELEKTLNKVLSFINENKLFAFGFSPFTSDTPHVYLDINRTKLSAYQVSLADLFSVLQNNLGSRYINNITLDGQINKVIIQADFDARQDISDIEKLYVANATGKLIQIKNFLSEKIVLMPKIIYRFNQYPSAGITAQTARHISSGTAIKTLQNFENTLGKEFSFAWTGLTLQEVETAGLALILITLALIFSYLFLVALYESWWIAFAVILTNVFAILGALIGLELWGLSLSIYAQLGIVMLIGLASKNAILIVQFTTTYQRSGMDTVQAAIKGSGERFRAVVMTALTFILGTFPMVVATGAGAASQRSIGITVFCGMIMATLVGILFVPVFFAFFDKISLKFSPKKHMKKMAVVFLLTGALTACMVGPDYERPQFFSDSQLEQALDAPSSQAVSFSPKDFKDKTLDALIEKAHQNSPTLKTALWRLHQSRASLNVIRSDLLPTLDALGQYNFIKDSKNMGLILQDSYYQAGLDVSWELDLFGGKRRRLQAERANLKSALYAVQNTMLSLTAEVTRLYIQSRTIEELIKQTKENIRLQTQMTELVRDKQKTGLASELSLQQALYLLKNTSATLSDLEYQQIETNNALALALGELPGSVEKIMAQEKKSLITKDFDFDLNKITAISAQVLQNRPDVKMAEENLIAQNELVGVALADMFPKISLSALFGFESLNWNKLFNNDSFMRTISPNISAPIFHFGALKENVKIQKAVKEEQILAYQQTLLQSAGEIKNAMVALFKERKRYQDLRETFQHADNVAQLMQSKYKNGLIDYTDVLQAEQNRLQSQMQMIKSSGALYTDLIRFYKAIGGRQNSDK